MYVCVYVCVYVLCTYMFCRQLQKRGDDVSMPPLLRRERGIRNKLKHEQVYSTSHITHHTLHIAHKHLTVSECSILFI